MGIPARLQAAGISQADPHGPWVAGGARLPDGTSCRVLFRFAGSQRDGFLTTLKTTPARYPSGAGGCSERRAPRGATSPSQAHPACFPQFTLVPELPGWGGQASLEPPAANVAKRGGLLVQHQGLRVGDKPVSQFTDRACGTAQGMGSLLGWTRWVLKVHSTQQHRLRSPLPLLAG